MTESIVKVHMQCYVPASVAWKEVELVVVLVVRWDMLRWSVIHLAERMAVMKVELKVSLMAAYLAEA